MYKLRYLIDGIEAVSKNHDPKKLRELIKEIEKSRSVIEWYLYNEGGIMLDSFREHKPRR